MTMNPGRLTAIALALGIALAAGTGTIAASAAPLASAASAHCSFGEHFVSVWKREPAALRSAEKELNAMKPGAERRAAAKKIRAKVLEGGYGAGVEVRAEWRKDHRGEKLRPLPDSLKDDLKTLHSTPKSGKVAEAEKIADKAVAGGYGATIESFAKAVKASTAWKGCMTSGS